MMTLYSLNAVLLVVCAVFFYRAGAAEDGPGMAWAAISVLISILDWQWLHWGLIGMILAQIGLFAGIGLVRVARKP